MPIRGSHVRQLDTRCEVAQKELALRDMIPVVRPRFAFGNPALFEHGHPGRIGELLSLQQVDDVDAVPGHANESFGDVVPRRVRFAVNSANRHCDERLRAAMAPREGGKWGFIFFCAATASSKRTHTP